MVKRYRTIYILINRYVHQYRHININTNQYGTSEGERNAKLKTITFIQLFDIQIQTP